MKLFIRLLFTLNGILLLTTNISAQINYQGNRSVFDESIAPFYHGVASGDPLSDKVIIWTRVTTSLPSVIVNWRIATDTDFNNIVSSGTFNTNSFRDYTVKIDVGGLQPNTYYYYQFQALGKYSQTGRTKTLPVGNVANFRIGFMSCTNYSGGYFNPYDVLRDFNNVDLVVHLGDYIYEDGFHANGVDTAHRKVVPLYDAFDTTTYRLRYGCYRLDPSLRELHRQFPWVIIWDDHEFANDATKDTAARHNPLTQGTWAIRKKSAIRVFKEWIPCREDETRTNIINHIQNIGDLADIIFTENRIEADTFISAQQALDVLLGPTPLLKDNPKRTMRGIRQINWITDNLKTSTAKWKVLANQLVFSPFYFKQVFTTLVRYASSWDAYPWDRKRILDTVAKYDIKNLVVLGGDIHDAAAFDIVHDSIPYIKTTGAGSLGVEFVCDNTSIGGILGGAYAFLYAANPHLKYVKTASQGFCILDIKKEQACCEYWQTDSVNTLNPSHKLLKTLCTNDQKNHLFDTIGIITTRNIYPPLVSYAVKNITTSIENNLSKIKEIIIYPNPTNQVLNLKYVLIEKCEFKIEIYSTIGKLVYENGNSTKAKGVYEDVLLVQNFPAGEYFISFIIDGKKEVKKFIKD